MNSIRLGGVNFRITTGRPEERGVSNENEFILVKTPAMLEVYDRLKAHAPKNILEIGMYEGGSLVYFERLFRPERIVGLDSRTQPIAALEKYKARRPNVVTYYSRYQEKAGTLMAARENFPLGIDLVVDDASHLYEQSKKTFEMLFPMVRPGGHYVIEDWSWSHAKGAQKAGHPWHDRPALTNLIFEIVLQVAKSAVVDSVEISRGLAVVRKGKGVYSSDVSDVSGILRGKECPRI